MLFLVDISGLIHAFYHVKAKSFEGEELIADSIKSLMIRLDKLRDYLPNAQHVCVFDNPDRNIFRKSLVPEYKSSRTHAPEIPLIEEEAKKALVNEGRWKSVIASECYEADDAMASMAKQYKGKVVIHSSDRDLRVCLEAGRVTILKSSRTPEPGGAMDLEYYTFDMFTEEFGFHAQCWPYYQLLVGGKDDIPGWEGVGDKKARTIMEHAMNHLDKIDVERADLKLNKTQKESYPEFKRQYRKLLMVRTLADFLPWPVHIERGA